ncbi:MULTISPECIES: hypothetical protein [unclassified Paenibacillus]|uniref:Uncharacterized protein n=1 Tax=Paenibacillus provencensis TaxID=441151 RepID=A0ABW3PV97_9BACL|nr:MULTISPECIES: hypothetical protein [unclassified Paenibacillus]
MRLRSVQPRFFIKGLLAEHGEVVIFTGVRIDESAKRASSIRKNGADEFIFQKYRTKKDKEKNEERKPMKGRFECHPIKDISDEVLWDTLMSCSPRFPWGTRFLQLYSLYKDSGECPMQIGEIKQSCGTSRNGCIICLFVKDDKMLKYFLDRGEKWAEPILKLRTIMRHMLYDANFREPIRKSRLKILDTVNPFLDNDEENGQLMIFDLESKDLNDEEAAPYEPLCTGGIPANPDLALASFSLQGRIFLLKNVLHYQKEADLEIVSKEDIEYIKSVWKLEMGWEENELDLTPEPIPYYGALVLNKEYQLNENETTIPNLVVDPRYYAIEEAILNQSRECSKLELDATKLVNLRVLNQQGELVKEKLNFIYYITTDFGGGEREIYEVLNRAKKVTGENIPYFWNPIKSNEFGRNVFWNNVTFVVSRGEIRSLEAARAFVNDYIDAGTIKTPVEAYSLERHYWQIISGKTPFEAKRVLLKAGFHSNQVPQSIKEYTGVLESELEVANAIKASIGDGFSYMTPERAREVCLSTPCWDEVFWTLLYDLRTPAAVKNFLIEKGYVPEVIPESIKFYSDISDHELYFGNKVRIHGLNEVVASLLFIPDQHHKLPEFIKKAMDKLLLSDLCEQPQY